MSIKSQKSLNEECSEIFERSYSVRSASEDTYTSEDEEEESLSRELLRKLTPAALGQLRRCFRRARDAAAAAALLADRKIEEVMRAAAAEEGIEFPATPQPQSQPQPQQQRQPLQPLQPPVLCLDEKGFVAAVDNIFGHREYAAHAQQLFRALDARRSGRVWWRQLVARLAAAGARRTASRRDRWRAVAAGAPRRVDRCQRESIVALVSIEREGAFSYACVSRGGRVQLCDGELQPLHHYEIFYQRTGVRRRVKNCWITDAIYLKDVQSVAFAASDRSLSVYDASAAAHRALYCVSGLPDIPTCLAYSCSLGGGGQSELLIGSERGDVTRLRFLQPRLSLFHTSTQDAINCYFWMELASPPHSHYVSVSTWRGVHARSVRRVAYARDGDLVWSCAHDARAAVRCRHAPGLLDDYVFRVQRGASCFHAVGALHVLATGGADGVVRLWGTQGAQFASLAVPGAPAVLDVAIVAAMDVVLAYCNNCSLHIWDLYEECLLQTVKIKFPFLGVLGKKADFGTVCIHPGPPRRKQAEEAGSAASGSRRGSSVYQGSTGGLLLLAEPAPAPWDQRDLRQDPEYIKYDRDEILITCCDYVCTVSLRAADCPVLPPPSDTMRARRPSFWELPADLIAPATAAVAKMPNPCPPSPRLLAPVAAEETLEDLDGLLEKAGLQGLLEKDFVLMRGLKHDLNKKLHHMETNKEATRSAVSAGAPYLALKSYEPDPLPCFDRLAEECSRVMRKFPEPTTLATPSGSEFSSPRISKSFKL